MKKYLCLLIALLLLLSACGKKPAAAPAQTPGDSAADAVPSNPEPAPEEEKNTEPVKNEVKEPEPHHPYEWLGLSGMPECRYLDLLSSNHYYQVYEKYDADGRTEIAEAADGIDSCLVTADSKSLSLNGMFYYIDETEKTYALYDYTDSVAQATAYMESVMAEGTNTKGRVFQGAGSSAVPLYAAAAGDTAEYEYYEFLTSNPGVNEITERFFMKDGDVFAIYTRTVAGESTEESTDVIKSISDEIPAALFVTPDLSGYTMWN